MTDCITLSATDVALIRAFAVLFAVALLFRLWGEK